VLAGITQALNDQYDAKQKFKDFLLKYLERNFNKAISPTILRMAKQPTSLTLGDLTYSNLLAHSLSLNVFHDDPAEWDWITLLSTCVREYEQFNQHIINLENALSEINIPRMTDAGRAFIQDCRAVSELIDNHGELNKLGQLISYHHLYLKNSVEQQRPNPLNVARLKTDAASFNKSNSDIRKVVGGTIACIGFGVAFLSMIALVGVSALFIWTLPGLIVGLMTLAAVCLMIASICVGAAGTVVYGAATLKGTSDNFITQANALNGDAPSDSYAANNHCRNHHALNRLVISTLQPSYERGYRR
jgi:hypothetical protein